jgi:hypothetical protein
MTESRLFGKIENQKKEEQLPPKQGWQIYVMFVLLRYRWSDTSIIR